MMDLKFTIKDAMFYLQNADDDSLSKTGKLFLTINAIAALLVLMGSKYSNLATITGTSRFSVLFTQAGVIVLALVALTSGMMLSTIARRRANVAPRYRQRFEKLLENHPGLRSTSTLAGTLSGQSIAVALVGTLFRYMSWPGSNAIVMVGIAMLLLSIGLIYKVMKSGFWDGPILAMMYRSLLPSIVLLAIMLTSTAT
jgi:hypothetical protein